MWDLFGLEKNPFELKAVEMSGIVPISTFVGREDYRHKLKQTIKTHNHSLNLIIGEKGAGKTSIGNVVRADFFEEYFTPLLEIDTQKDWTAKEFIQEALAVLQQAVIISHSRTNLSKTYTTVCEKIQNELKSFFIEEQQSIGGQAFGFGFETGSSKSMKKTTHTILKEAFRKITQITINAGYKGLILQFNNLDNLEIEDPKKLSNLFSDLRDFLLTENAHFIFLGDKLMEAGFKYNPKVNECITSDFHLTPFDFKTIQKILQKRYEVFKIKDRQPVHPLSDDAVKLICEVFDGNIRQVFYSLDSASQGAEKILKIPKQLNKDETKKILFELASERIRQDIPPKAFDVLKFILKQKRDVTNTEITKAMKLKTQNTSKYLGNLKNNNLVIIVDKIGRKVFYRAVHEARWLLLDPAPGHQTGITQF